MISRQPQASMVFVLDDEPAVRDSLRDLLESEHYQVQTFGSPSEFLQSPGPHQNACLILDLNMPEQHGLEVLKAVARRRPTLPTIVLTAYAEVPWIVQAMKTGAVNFLEKPCRDNELLAAVREAITHSEQSREQQVSSDAVQSKIERLSQREQEILRLLVSGQNVKQIALHFGTSPNTVRNQRSSLLEKMETNSVADVIRMVLEAG